MDDGVESVTESILAYVGEDEGLCPRFRGHRVWIKPTADRLVEEEFLLVTLTDMVAFLGYVCPRLQERRELRDREVAVENAYEQMRQDATEAQRVRSETAMENVQLRQQLQVERKGASEAKQRLREGKEKVLQREQQSVSEVRKACADAARESEWLKGLNKKLQQDISEAERGIVEARRDVNEARVEASSLQKKLVETETACEEAKKHFIQAPDLVPCLRPLTDEVKTLQENVQTSGERTAEMVAKRPAEGRRSERTLLQMKRVLHDLGRFPRRRRTRAADAADNGGGAIKRGRLCYMCRCKGHLAKDCPQARTDAVASADPTTSDAHQKTEGSQEANAESTGWNIFSVFRRTFTSGVD